MADDFNPQKTIETIEVWTGQRLRKVFSPAVGSRIAVVYIEASDNISQINALLSQLEPLGDEFNKVLWTTSAEPDCEPSVDVRVTVRTDVPVPE